MSPALLRNTTIHARTLAVIFSLLALAAVALGAPHTHQRSIDAAPFADGHLSSAMRRHTAADVAAHVPAERDTNASRMRRGLPPIPPVRRVPHNIQPNAHQAAATDSKQYTNNGSSGKNGHQKNKNKNKHHGHGKGGNVAIQVPSGTSDEPATAPSASPSAVPVSGSLVVVREESNEVLGLVSRSPHASDIQRFGLTTDPKDALTVTLRSPSAIVPGALSISDPENGYHHLGFVTGPSSLNARLDESSESHVLLTATDHTAAGSTPQAAGAAYGSGLVESSVWTLDRRDGQLTARWINADGFNAGARMMYLPRENALLVTGNVEHIKRTFDEDAVPVVLRLV
ncbi:hypothetical protein BKA62DRAFT_64231 [Auriculariales sp. MPI-PUGE-AT-0066]|nr:hypothetical protein BKA62DRAFT_64231 [Auriculariales sp. MPI-PUGE-AT-0066]